MKARMKKRLLKDLPFSNLKAGTVIWKGGRGHGGNYSVSTATSYYEVGGSSDNGIKTFDESSESILDTIWDNNQWFEDATLDHVDFIANTGSITLRFKPIDQGDAEDLAKGLQHILNHLEDGNYVWNKFKNITTSMKSR